MDTIVLDLRYALRSLGRQPAFAAVAILTLALGIGANSAIFSVVYSLLLKPLPFREPEQLIYVHDTYPAVALASVSWQKFLALRDDNRTLTALGAVASGTVTITITGRDEPQQIAASRVSGDFFSVFGVAPVAGRWISRDDDVPNGNPVIVLSYGLWQRSFGGNPAIIGQIITTDGRPRTIVGIMPADFMYPARVDGWVPLALPQTTSIGNNFLRLIGRMATGTSVQRAADDLKRVAAAFNQQNGLKRDVRVYPLHDYLAQGSRQMLLVLQGAVVLVLLVACANIANMQLARSIARQRELSIRSAIGAGPARLVRQLLTECVLLAGLGGGGGVLLGSWLLRLLLALAPTGFSGVQTIAIDRHVLWFTLAIAMLTGVVFGLAPARRGFRIDANEGLRDTGARGATSGGAQGASRALVVVEIGLAIVLVIGAGLMVKSLLRMQAQDSGFRPEHLLTFQINLPASRYDDDRARRTMRQMLDDLRAIPGVTAAGAINFLPLTNFGFNTVFSIQGRPPSEQPDRAPVVEFRVVTPGYFAAMNIPIRRGAEFTDRQSEHDGPDVLINETMARQFWPNENPIGAHVRLGMDPGTITREIVGVVGDVRSQALNRPPVPESFVPYAQAPAGSMGIAIRTETEPAALLLAVRQRFAAIDPDLPLVRPQTMNAVVDASAGSQRLSSTLTSVFALLAALLASVGVYSLVAYSVAQRTREMGIRVALGASPSAVLRLIVGEGLVLAAFGVVFGLAGTWALTGTLRTMLYEVSPTDPGVLAATCAAALLVTAAAAFLPARRVIRVDPTIALREE